MKRKDLSIKTYRDYLEESAKRGEKSCIEAIEELDRPIDCYTYYEKVPGKNIRKKLWVKKNNE